VVNRPTLSRSRGIRPILTSAMTMQPMSVPPTVVGGFTLPIDSLSQQANTPPTTHRYPSGVLTCAVGKSRARKFLICVFLYFSVVSVVPAFERLTTKNSKK